MYVALEASDIESIAQRVADLVGREQAVPWLDAQGAADYMAAPLSRVRKLTMTGDLRSHKDGGRRLYRREDIDEFIYAGGASTK